MENPSSGTAAAARVAAGRKGKVGRGQAFSSIGHGPVGGRSTSVGSLLPFGRGSSRAAGLVPFGCSSSPAAPLSGNGEAASSSTMAQSGAAESPPISGFTSHGGGGFAGTTLSPPSGFPFPPSPSPSPAWWGSDTASPGCSSVRQSDATWDGETQDGLMRYFGNQAHNFHLVGTPSHSSHINVSIPETNGGSSPSDVEIISEQEPVFVIDKNGMVRTEKRIMWTPDEDERLMAAWIENSIDSVTGADRKGEAYWGDVIKAYNKGTPPQRQRKAKQAKDRCHKINRWCDLFEGDYLKARKVFTSGYNDQMWMDAAEEFYLDHKIGPFTIKNVWKICRKMPKWKTYNDELKNARKRKSYHHEEDVQNVESEDEMPKRPIGQKAAKKAALAEKGILRQ